MKRFSLLFAFTLVLVLPLIASPAVATTPGDVDDAATAELVTSADPDLVVPSEEIFPELDVETVSAQACHDNCYNQAQACIAGCGSNQACINNCYAAEFQCNCSCGAIPFCP